jgi:transposase InsO family protein
LRQSPERLELATGDRRDDYPGTVSPQPWQLWSSEDDNGTQGGRPRRWRAPGRSADEDQRDQACPHPQAQGDNGQPSSPGGAANWLDGDFAADAPNRKWAGDVTYIWASEGWLYLAVIVDLHSRRVVGWAVSDRMKKDLAIRALDMAVRLRQPPEGCLFHLDRGSQYCSYDYQKKLQAYGLRPSMSGKGNCYDNASVETFFKSLKAELIWRQSWPTRRQADAGIFQ